MKACRGCHNELSLEEFHCDKRSRDGRTTKCRDCVSTRLKEYYADNREDVKTKSLAYYYDNQVAVSLRISARAMGIDLELVQKHYEEHNGLCDICGEPPTTRRKARLCIDHDHVSGKFRGLLCNYCNVMLGHAKDDVEILEMAIQYLIRSSTVRRG